MNELSRHLFLAGFITVLDEPLSAICGQVRTGFNQRPNLLPSDVLCTLGNTPALETIVFPVISGLIRIPPGVLSAPVLGLFSCPLVTAIVYIACICGDCRLTGLDGLRGCGLQAGQLLGLLGATYPSPIPLNPRCQP